MGTHQPDGSGLHHFAPYTRMLDIYRHERYIADSDYTFSSRLQKERPLAVLTSIYISVSLIQNSEIRNALKSVVIFFLAPQRQE
jgi:hypothetical protein